MLPKIIKKFKGYTYPYNGVIRQLNKFVLANYKIARVNNRIDVILLTLNRLEDTKRTLRSLYETTVEFNLIIIDQLSDDGTREFAQDFADSHDNVTLKLMNENIGVSGGRSLGVELSKEKYIAFIDNDMAFMPGYFENIVQKLESDSNIAAILGKVITPDFKVELNSPVVEQNGDWLLFKDVDAKKDFDDPGTSETHPTDWVPGVAIWRSEVLKKVQIDSDLIGAYEDNEYSLRVKQAGYKFSNCPEALVLHIRAEFTKALLDKNYTKGRHNPDKLRFAVKRFYKKHKKFLAVGDIDGFCKNIGFSNREDYIRFVKSN